MKKSLLLGGTLAPFLIVGQTFVSYSSLLSNSTSSPLPKSVIESKLLVSDLPTSYTLTDSDISTLNSTQFGTPVTSTNTHVSTQDSHSTTLSATKSGILTPTPYHTTLLSNTPSVLKSTTFLADFTPTTNLAKSRSSSSESEHAMPLSGSTPVTTPSTLSPTSRPISTTNSHVLSADSTSPGLIHPTPNIRSSTGTETPKAKPTMRPKTKLTTYSATLDSTASLPTSKSNSSTTLSPSIRSSKMAPTSLHTTVSLGSSSDATTSGQSKTHTSGSESTRPPHSTPTTSTEKDAISATVTVTKSPTETKKASSTQTKDAINAVDSAYSLMVAFTKSPTKENARKAKQETDSALALIKGFGAGMPAFASLIGSLGGASSSLATAVSNPGAAAVAAVSSSMAKVKKDIDNAKSTDGNNQNSHENGEESDNGADKDSGSDGGKDGEPTNKEAESTATEKKTSSTSRRSTSSKTTSSSSTASTTTTTTGTSESLSATFFYDQKPKSTGIPDDMVSALAESQAAAIGCMTEFKLPATGCAVTTSGSHSSTPKSASTSSKKAPSTLLTTTRSSDNPVQSTKVKYTISSKESKLSKTSIESSAITITSTSKVTKTTSTSRSSVQRSETSTSQSTTSTKLSSTKTSTTAASKPTTEYKVFDPVCNKGSDEQYKDHPAVHESSVENLAAKFCSTKDVTGGDIYGTAVKPGYSTSPWSKSSNGAKFEFSIKWVDGCITEMATQGPWKPLLGTGNPSCSDMFYEKIWKMCNNGGIGGCAQAGCLKYTMNAGVVDGSD